MIDATMLSIHLAARDDFVDDVKVKVKVMQMMMPHHSRVKQGA